MAIGYSIFVGYALLGFLYAPSLASMTAFTFVAASCSPLLLALRTEPRTYDLPPPRSGTFWAVMALGFLNLTIVAQRVGESPGTLTSVDGLVTVAGLSTAARYGDIAPSGNPLLLAFSLWLVFRAGASAAQVSASKQLLAALPVILYTLLTTEKWGLYLTFVFFFTGLFVGLPTRLALRKAVTYLIWLAPFGALVSAGSLVLRGRSADLWSIGSTLLHYIFAQYTALGSWLIDRSAEACCSLGTYTFVGPLNALGVVTRRAGVFTEQVAVYGIETNIYTAFRYLVADFSLLGPFILASGVAALYVAFHRLRSTLLRRQVEALVIFAAMLSLNTTPFTHNSVALALIMSLGSLAIPQAAGFQALEWRTSRPAASPAAPVAVEQHGLS